MIRADRELLAELALLNSDVVPLAMRMMDDTATADEQRAFAERLVAMARKLNDRAAPVIIEVDASQ
jgi:EAL domain-containing protein (putative c-di-GMP-specific phosphodiesterase class I)